MNDLRETVNAIISRYQPVASQQKSLFVNEISAGACPISELETVNNFLNSLFYCIARCTEEGCIRVSAAMGGGIAELTITSNKDSSCYQLLNKMEHLRLLAKKIGGMLQIAGRNSQTSIVFSFINERNETQMPAFRSMANAGQI